MERTEWRQGLAALRRLADGLEAIVADPEALARMDRAALADPTLLEGPTLAEWLGLDTESDFLDSESDGFPLS